MGGTSEREFQEKIINVKTKANKKTAEVMNDFVKMHKMRTDTTKKSEEMKLTAERDLDKIEREIMKSKDLVAESRPRLNAEIKAAKEQISEKYANLKERIRQIKLPE